LYKVFRSESLLFKKMAEKSAVFDPEPDSVTEAVK
jgi:hypothetical protein